MKILITGYTYTRENLFEVFNSYPERENLYFILPDNWEAKDGKVKFPAFKKEGFNIYNSRAFFFHSNYPIIGGLFKGWMPFFIFRLVWLRLTKRINVLFSTGEPNLLSTTYNAILAKLLGMKHVFNYWENIPYENKDKGFKIYIKKLIIKMNCALSDGAICGMHKAEDILKDIYPTIPTLVSLHAGFNIERFRPELGKEIRARLNLENKTVFLFVGALGQRKGIHLALEALANLAKKYKDLYFLIIGSGEYEEALKNKTNSLGLNGFVKFIPWMSNEELPAIYGASDIFLYPSMPSSGWEEQFGYSIAEASLCGLPVISTKSGTINEVLLDGKTGIMVESNNEKQLEEVMEKLIIDKSLRSRLGESGRKYIVDNFSNNIIASNLFNFFQKI